MDDLGGKTTIFGNLHITCRHNEPPNGSLDSSLINMINHWNRSTLLSSEPCHPSQQTFQTWNFRPGDPPEYRKLGKTWFVAVGSLLLSSHRSKWWNHFAQPHQDGLPSLLHSILHRSAAPCWKILWVLKKPEFAAHMAAGMHLHMITKTIQSIFHNSL